MNRNNNNNNIDALKGGLKVHLNFIVQIDFFKDIC